MEELVGREGVRYVEILFSPIPPEAWLASAGLPEGATSTQGNVLLLRAASYDEANAWIGKFREAGAHVRSCVPVKRHLEDIYVERMGGDSLVPAEAVLEARRISESGNGGEG